MLPFTTAQFVEVFGAYNNAIWPAQIVVYIVASAGVALLFKPGTATDRIVSGILASMWGFAGIVYHWIYFAPINAAALIFGFAFLAQSVIFVMAGVVRRELQFAWTGTPRCAVGLILIVYAAAVYPLAGLALGHVYPALPLFGVAPCPILIFTFGCLLMLQNPVAWWVMVVPLLWSIIGGSAAILLDVPQDLMLPVSGLLTVGMLAGARPRLLRWR